MVSGEQCAMNHSLTRTLKRSADNWDLALTSILMHLSQAFKVVQFAYS